MINERVVGKYAKVFWQRKSFLVIENLFVGGGIIILLLIVQYFDNSTMYCTTPTIEFQHTCFVDAYKNYFTTYSKVGLLI